MKKKNTKRQILKFRKWNIKKKFPCKVKIIKFCNAWQQFVKKKFLPKEKFQKNVFFEQSWLFKISIDSPGRKIVLKMIKLFIDLIKQTKSKNAKEKRFFKVFFTQKREKKIIRVKFCLKLFIFLFTHQTFLYTRNPKRKSINLQKKRRNRQETILGNGE